MENSITIQVPISISYPALEGVLKKQMIGEYIPKPEEGEEVSPYAQILDLGITGNSTGSTDVNIWVRIRILRTVLKRDQVDLYARVRLGYDNATQQLFVQQFHMNSRTSSGFYNTALEVLVNKVAYNQILKKTRFDLSEIISKELVKVNELLEKGFEVKGVKLLGGVKEVRVQDMVTLPEKVSLLFELKGDLEVSIHDLTDLMPAI